jgi:SAM-dependent methyltransferase
MDDMVHRHGPWTAHNVHLGHGIYPLGEEPNWDDQKLHRVRQIVGDTVRQPLAGVRILDLGCLEGLYAVEFARLGAEVTAIEGRRSNLAKVELAQEAWQLETLTLLHNDVRRLSVERFGMFEIVLCLGILYHLPLPDVFRFIEQVAAVCRRVAVFDTHVSLQEETHVEDRGRVYRGRIHREHEPETTSEERLAGPWSSLDNETSFWPTRESLFNLIEHARFSSAYECRIPVEPNKPEDRLTVMALKSPAGDQMRAPCHQSQ